jgi:hypothetical protein
MGNMPHIGDDEKLDLIPGWSIINAYETVSVDGAKIDLCIRYVEERHAGRDHGGALASCGQTLRAWYPSSPPIWGNADPHPEPGPDPGPDPGPAPGPEPQPPIHPDLEARKIPWGRQLDCTGQAYILRGDGTPRLAVGVHAGDFLGQWVTRPDRRDLLLVALDEIYEAGYSWMRCWFNVDPNPWWNSNGIAKTWNPITTPGFDQEYDALLHELEQRQILLHLAAGGLDILPKAKYREMFQWLTARVAHEPWRYSLIEACNEAGITAADWSPDELAQLVQECRPHVLCALSAHSGTEDRDTLNAYTPGWMRFCYYHSYRQGHLHDKYRHHFSFVRYEGGEDPVRRLAWSGEPTGPGPRVSDTQNREELEQIPGAASALHVQTALSHTLPCYMCSPGVIFDRAFSSMPGFGATPWAVSRLPQDIHAWALTHGGMPDAIFKATTSSQGLVRADQAIGSGSRVVSTFYAEKQGGGRTDMPIAGNVEGVLYDGMGQEIWAGQVGGAINVPAYPLAYFVGRRI